MTGKGPRQRPPRGGGIVDRPRPRTVAGRADQGGSRRGGGDGPQAGARTRSQLRVAGLPAAIELLKQAPERVERVCFLAELKPELQAHLTLLGKAHKPWRAMAAEELARVAGTQMHGGVVVFARAPELRTATIEDVRRWAAAGEPLLVLDGVGNPQNVGAIARTAAFFALKRVLISDHPEQAGLSDAAFRIAKGGLEHVEVWRCAGLDRLLAASRGHYHVIGTALARAVGLDRVRRDGRPVALVLGNEEVGLPPATLAACETSVRLGSDGPIQSLNVSVAAGILIHALLAT
jgi:TrmH RNA methyltransferase